jgi:ubiquinone/menaquinone biosynthesis C-methylase UbiE
MRKIKFSENKKKVFYEDYFSLSDYQAFRNDLGSVCTRNIIRSQITKDTGNLLEIGTGISSLLEDLQQFNCYGIDVSEKTIRTIKTQFQRLGKKAHFSICDAEKLPFPDNFFDVIVSSHTLEHIKNDTNVFLECSRILKTGGELIIFVPGRKSGIATKHEKLNFGHYRYYNLKRFKTLEQATNHILTLQSIYYPHKVHNLIWNKLKHILRWANYPIKKLIIRDNKTFEIRPTYQKIILPILSKLLNALDRCCFLSEKNLLGTEFNVLVRFEKKDV